MGKRKRLLNNNENHYKEQNKQYKNKSSIIKDKIQLNDNKHNVDYLSASVLELRKVFY